MKISCRFAEPAEATQFIEWMTSTNNNLFDPSIVKYPSLRTVVVEKDGEPQTYVPFHPVLVLESLAQRPGLTPRENAVGLRRLQDTIESTAKQYGMAEVWWMCADKDLIHFAQQHGYEVIKTAVLRKKVE